MFNFLGMLGKGGLGGAGGAAGGAAGGGGGMFANAMMGGQKGGQGAAGGAMGGLMQGLMGGGVQGAGQEQEALDMAGMGDVQKDQALVPPPISSSDRAITNSWLNKAKGEMDQQEMKRYAQQQKQGQRGAWLDKAQGFAGMAQGMAGQSGQSPDLGAQNQQEAFSKLGSVLGALGSFYTGNFAGAASSMKGASGTNRR